MIGKDFFLSNAEKSMSCLDYFISDLDCSALSLIVERRRCALKPFSLFGILSSGGKNWDSFSLTLGI